MKKASSLLFLFFYSLLLNAQESYKEGYIVTNENDTLYGFVDFRTDEINATRCRFRSAEDSKIEEYAPGKIKAYRIPSEGRYYLSRTVPVKEISKTVFIEYLVQGKVNLFYYKINEKNEYYYMEKEDGTLTAITQKPDWIERDEYLSGKNVKKTDKKYIGVLSYLMQDAPALNKEIEKTEFDRRSMIRLSEGYHKETCAPGEECIVFVNDYNRISTKLRFSVYGGYGFYKPNDAGLSDTGAPLIGLQADVSDARISDRLNLLLDASFTNVTMNAKTDENLTLKFSAINTNLALRLTLSQESKIRPFVEAGLSEQFIYPLNNKYKVDNYLRDFYVCSGFTGGAGINFIIIKDTRIFCKVDYTKLFFGGVPFSAIFSSGNNWSVINLKLGYTF